ncbi:MAG: Na(+)-translocating NADH-quinone reductase subunit A [Firmicutes bacterium]|nr:Na(+)-translocating NADH-quinone reductase subunit A [Bacillota bacterium]MCM1402034.1 Na(+)-translocating NADH-quinone reductase subunit A [Bacteroides sp.]MCM1476605.1 Na(+)-translocating NADH-quinone reductase subunit A [Bacteroides sp.]
MSKTIKLSKGLDLQIQGALESPQIAETVTPKVVAIYPDDFPGFTPKPLMHEGDPIAAGQPLLFDKVNGKVNLVSPADGIVKAIVRGERRKIIRVEVECGNQGQPEAISTPVNPSAEQIREALMASGLWCYLRQRPYDIVPTIDNTPVNIFVTAFDSAPLAPSLTAMVEGKEKEIAKGVEWLAALTSGKVYISTRPDSPLSVPAPAEHVLVSGSHPAGNPGVQAANIAPVNKGQVIWTLDIVTVARIGQLALTGRIDWNTNVALVGSEVENPKMIRTTIGSSITPIIKGNLKPTDKHIRIISGNVLTGTKVGNDGFLHFPYRQLTVMPEGDDVDEFMGWASMSPNKMSASHSFLSSLFHGRKYSPDARLNGGRRAMIMSGQYDKVLPMDILPEYLIKAILARDIDQMERLGIYEVAPEDFALCEYVDPSKLELQKIVRQGLDYLRKELE